MDVEQLLIFYTAAACLHDLINEIELLEHLSNENKNLPKNLPSVGEITIMQESETSYSPKQLCSPTKLALAPCQSHLSQSNLDELTNEEDDLFKKPPLFAEILNKENKTSDSNFPKPNFLAPTQIPLTGSYLENVLNDGRQLFENYTQCCEIANKQNEISDCNSSPNRALAQCQSRLIQPDLDVLPNENEDLFKIPPPVTEVVNPQYEPSDSYSPKIQFLLPTQFPLTGSYLENLVYNGCHIFKKPNLSAEMTNTQKENSDSPQTLLKVLQKACIGYSMSSMFANNNENQSIPLKFAKDKKFRVGLSKREMLKRLHSSVRKN